MLVDSDDALENLDTGISAADVVKAKTLNTSSLVSNLSRFTTNVRALKFESHCTPNLERILNIAEETNIQGLIGEGTNGSPFADFDLVNYFIDHNKSVQTHDGENCIGLQLDYCEKFRIITFYAQNAFL